jgi:hypothetical protein
VRPHEIAGSQRIRIFHRIHMDSGPAVRSCEDLTSALVCCAQREHIARILNTSTVAVPIFGPVVLSLSRGAIQT